MEVSTKYARHRWVFLVFGAVAGVLLGTALETEGFAHLREFLAGSFAGQWNKDMAAHLSKLLGALFTGVLVMYLVWAMWAKSKTQLGR